VASDVGGLSIKRFTNEVDDNPSIPSANAGARNGIAENWVASFEAALPLLTVAQTTHIASAAATALPHGNGLLAVVFTNGETKSLKDIGPPADVYRQFFD
jgi:hypothetical protein